MLNQLTKNSFSPLDLESPFFGKGSLNNVEVVKKNLKNATKFLEHKKWHFITIASNDFFLALAMVDLGYAANAFITLIDLKKNATLLDHSYMATPKIQLKVNDSPGEGSFCSFESTTMKMKLHRPLNSDDYQLVIKSRELNVDVSLKVKSSPLVVVGNNHTFTQKTNLMKISGVIKFRNENWDLAEAYGGLDYSTGLYPRKTQWYWAFGLGKTTENHEFGFNLALGNNLGGQKENAVWFNGEIIELSEAEFEFDKMSILTPWKMKTKDTILELTFHPRGIHKDLKNFVLIESRFHQLYGFYSGIYKDPKTQKTHEFSGLPGISEDQYVKW